MFSIPFYDERKKIVDIGLRMVNYGLTYASLGNISVRIDDEKILITPSGIRFDEMKPEQIVLVNIEGSVLEKNKKPSTELPMHLEIYRHIPKAKAIIHAHAPFATALLPVIGSLDSDTEDAKTFDLSRIVSCEYAPAGTKELARNVVRVLKDYEATVIPNHGVVVRGENLDIALKRLEALENIARIETLKHILAISLYLA